MDLINQLAKAITSDIEIYGMTVEAVTSGDGDWLINDEDGKQWSVQSAKAVSQAADGTIHMEFKLEHATEDEPEEITLVMDLRWGVTATNVTSPKGSTKVASWVEETKQASQETADLVEAILDREGIGYVSIDAFGTEARITLDEIDQVDAAITALRGAGCRIQMDGFDLIAEY